ncbi:MAG: hypothetical protein D6755_09195 [Anaerolineae bacterium]|nr:MAG: hypothetical protein D6755_09195 [Anaerolineae bacterium]
MSRNATLRLISALLFLGSLGFGFWAWQQWQHAIVVVEWSTASELDTVGFNVFRSETESGPYTQVNQNIIPAAGDSLTGSDYRFEDRDVRTGRTYYYELEDVNTTGTGTRHGPIVVQARGQIGYPAVLSLALLLGAAFAWMGISPAQLKEKPDA